MSWTIPREQKFGESAQQGEIVNFLVEFYSYFYVCLPLYMYFYVVCEM